VVHPDVLLTHLTFLDGHTAWGMQGYVVFCFVPLAFQRVFVCLAIAMQPSVLEDGGLCKERFPFSLHEGQPKVAESRSADGDG
jgi:hypothetical protein